MPAKFDPSVPLNGVMGEPCAALDRDLPSPSIKVLRSGGFWKVVGAGVHIEARVLAWAAFDALTLADLNGTVVELGEGVPEDALAQGRKLAEIFAGVRHDRDPEAPKPR